MQVLHAVDSYRKAVATVVRGKGLGYAKAVRSVLSARLEYGIGPFYHSLYDLISVDEDQWRDFVINQRLWRALRRLNSESSQSLARDKFAFFRHCQNHAIPSVPILCAVGNAFDDSELQARTPERWASLIGDAHTSLFIKLVDGAFGRDAFSADRSTDGCWRFLGHQGTLTDLYAFCKARLGDRKGWIVQSTVRPHEKLARIMAPNSLGTLRIVTGLRKNEVSVICAALRIPAAGNRTDNFSAGATGNLVAPVDVETGVTGVARGSLDRKWPRIECMHIHPDSACRIDGLRIPFWDEAMRCLDRAHRSMPDAKSLGWDVAITAEGPLVVETNAFYSMDVPQVAHRRGFGKELTMLLDTPLCGPSLREHGSGGGAR